MEQFDRVERYLNRIRKVYSGENLILWDHRRLVEDYILSFFIHCNHLRDWVDELNKVGVSRSEINSFISNHDSLKLCADLANSSKHCVLKNSGWSKVKPHFSVCQFESNGNVNDPGIKGKFSVVTRNEIIDVLELAESCWKHWQGYRQLLMQKPIIK